MAPLPPDLSRIGDELTAAAARSLRARRRRALAARVAATLAAGALALAAIGASHHGPAQGTRGPSPLLASTHSALADGCDQPRGARSSLPGCTRLTATYVDRATLPHGTSLWPQS